MENSEAQLNEAYMVEQAAINWLKKERYEYIHGSELSPENGERESYRDVVLKRRFISAIKRINPWIDDRIAEEVYRKVRDIPHPDFVMKSKIFYDYLTEGVKVVPKKGEERARIVRIIDFENIHNNEFLVANQFTVEYQYEVDMHRRPDMVIFINGLPLIVFEFKSFNANETAKDAFNDHKTKIKDIPQLYQYSQILVVSDGLETRYGSPTSDWERFFVWEGLKSDDDVEIEELEEGHYRYLYDGEEITSLELLIKGLFRREHLIEYLRDFIFHLKSGETYTKMIAMYHQFYTVKKAIEKTKKCVLEGKTPEERRIGVVWHTQGSGKSFTMLLYARRALREKELENPLLLFLTDRKNLDEQLYGLFSQMAVAKRVDNVKELHDILKTASGGLVFSTIQKFGEFGKYLLVSCNEEDYHKVKTGKIRRGLMIGSLPYSAHGKNEKYKESRERDYRFFIQIGDIVIGEAKPINVIKKKVEKLSMEDLVETGFETVEEIRLAIEKEIRRKNSTEFRKILRFI